MSREKELIKNSLVLGMGQLLPKFVSIITLPIVTASLTKAEYGSYDLITTLVMLFLPIVTLQIQSSAFRFLIDCREDEQKKTKIITSIFVVTVPTSCIASMLIVFFMPGIEWSVAIAVGIYFFVDIINIMVSQIVRGLGMNKEYSISSILMSVLNGIGIVIALDIYSTGLFGVVVTLCIANGIAIVYLSYRAKIFQYIKLKTASKTQIIELLSYSWPMIPNNLSNWVLKMSDRMVITVFLGIEANAVYAVANKIPNLLALAQTVFVMAWQENASIVVKDDDATEYYSRMFEMMFKVLFVFTALLICCTPVMFSLLIKGDYAEAYCQIPILILGMFFYAMSAFQGGIYIAHKKTKSVGVSTIIAAILNLVIDLLFINIIGITAGSISTLVAYLALYIFRMVHSLTFQPMNYNVRMQVGLLLFIFVMLFLSFLQILWVNVINFVLGIGISIFICRQLFTKKIYKNTSKEEV